MKRNSEILLKGDPPISSRKIRVPAALSSSQPLRRGQFSLRTLFWIMTAVCIIATEVAYGEASWYINVYCSLALLHGLVLVWAYVAWTMRRPDWRVLAVIAAIAACWAVVSLIHHGGSNHSLLSAFAVIQLAPALLSWPTAWLTWRVLARSPRDFDLPAIRDAALRSLCAGGLLGSFAAITLYSKWHQRDSGFTNDDPFFPAGCVAVGAAVAAAIPWIVLLRRRARGSATNRSWIDKLAKALLATGIGLALAGWAAAAYLLVVREAMDAQPFGSLGWFIAYLLFFILSQFGSVGLFLLGLTIELFRDRWHPILTAVGCAYFIPFWLIIANDERLIFVAI